MTRNLIVCLEARLKAPEEVTPPVDGRRSDAEIAALQRGILALAGIIEEESGDR